MRNTEARFERTQSRYSPRLTPTAKVYGIVAWLSHLLWGRP